MTGVRLLAGAVIVSLLVLPVTGIGVMAQEPSRGPTAVFLSDDRDPLADERPPFLLPDSDDFGQFGTISPDNASRTGDFVYTTTQPSTEIGPRQQTLQEYRYSQLQSIERNQSTSLWLPDSHRSNGTVVRDAHVTILGTREGTQTRLTGTTNQRNTTDELLFIPRNGTVLTHLDYATATPNETPSNDILLNKTSSNNTCTVSNGTKTCVNSTITKQSVNRSLRIGSQTWQADADTPRQLAYANATATEPTTLVVTATITSTVDQETTTYTRDNGEWQHNQTVHNETALSQTVQDQARVVVTTNQDLSVTQTLVTSDGELTKIALQFDGPATLTERRLWSSAQFTNETGRLDNIWGIYSQRSETTAYRSSSADTQRERVAFPNVLELQLIASSAAPSLTMADDTAVGSRPEIVRMRTVSLVEEPAPLDPQVRLPSKAPTTPTTLVITNAEQPITTMRDIHGDSIPITTQTASERAVELDGAPLNETHAQLQLTDVQTGEPLSGRTLWLNGAAQGTVTTNAQGTATVERRDLYVTASFPGATNVSRRVYYDSAQTQLAFQPDPFNIYQLLRSLAGAIVSIAAFLVFFLPFAYLRR